MKLRILPIYLLIALNILPFTKITPWGDKGHRLITQKSFDCLPKEMMLFAKYKPYIIEHSTDPDHRKRQSEDEAPKHFINIDCYPEFRTGKMIMNLDTLLKFYSDSVVKKIGTLPWATENTLKELTNAFREKNKEKILFYASDLAHYVEDGYQPLHAVENYNGQLSGQKGIHSRYESKMFEKYEDVISQSVRLDEGYFIKDTEKYIFNYITASDIDMDIILNADKLASQNSSSSYNDEYYRLLWFRTQYLTEDVISEAARTLASMYYTAWINAGKPPFEENAQ